MGGALTGLIIGILVGLVLALGVAFYVNKVPVPFVDRGVTRKPAQDAAEDEHNKGWNPNAGLVSNQPPVVTPAQDGPTTPEGPTLLSPGADTPPGDAAAGTESDPIGDLVRSKLEDQKPAPAVAPSPGAAAAPAPTAPVATAAPAPAAPLPFTYFVQVGAFRSSADAEAQRAKVALMGMAATVTEREQAGRPVFRVRLGPFNQKPMAEATRDQLTSGGVEATLVRVER